MSDHVLQFSLLGYPARFAHAQAFWLLLVLAALISLSVYALWRRSHLFQQSTGRLGPRIAPEANAARPAAKLALQSAGLFLLVVALAGPQCGTRTELTKRYGIDLVVALDGSRSMLARDVAPDRMTRAKQELTWLLDHLAGNRVALLVFGEEAYPQCPLTTDYAAAKMFLRTVGPESIPSAQQGTSIENALAGAAELLSVADRGARSKAILLITDGEDHEPGALEEASKLAESGIRVFAIGIGSAEGAPIPMVEPGGNVSGYRKDDRGETILTRLDEGLLKEIAERTQGRYFHAGATDFGLGEVQAELDRMEKSELEGRLSITYEERYAFLAFPAFLLLLIGLLLREGRPASAMRGPQSTRQGTKPQGGTA